MARHERLLELAYRVALTSDHERWQLGAVMTRGSTFLASSPNKFRNPPWVSHIHATTHAEVGALRRCLLNSARGSTMYVARVDKDGLRRMARPCNKCMKTLKDAGVRRVVYTTNDGSFQVERVRDAPESEIKLGVDTRSRCRVS